MVAAQRTLTLILITIVVDGSRQSAIVDLTKVTSNSSGFANNDGGEVFSPESIIQTKDDEPFIRVPLCCPEGYALGSEGCVEDEFTLNHSRPQSWNVFVDNPCKNVPLYADLNIGPYQRLEDDLIYLPNEDRSVGLGSYCLFREPNSSSYNLTLTCPNHLLILCHIVCTAVSILFMLTTFLVYCIIEKYNNLRGWILRGFLTSYICGMIAFTAFILRNDDPVSINDLMLGYVTLYFGLACLLWLNVMSFDVWQNFGDFAYSHDFHLRNQLGKRMAWYSIYVWCASAGPPAVLIVTTILLRATSYESAEIYVIMILTISPILFSVISNSYFYISGALSIMQYEKKMIIPTVIGANENYQKNKVWLNLCSKLFVIIVCHLILWVALFEWDNDALAVFVFILEAIKGGSVFIIFVWRDDVKRSLREQSFITLRRLDFFIPQDPTPLDDNLTERF